MLTKSVNAKIVKICFLKFIILLFDRFINVHIESLSSLPIILSSPPAEINILPNTFLSFFQVFLWLYNLLS